MDKAQAIQAFWGQFLPAYDENTVPPDASMPYITYAVSTDSIGNPIGMTASLWYHSDSWKEITAKSEYIAEHIVKMYPPAIKLNTGRLYIAKGRPFAQRMDDPEDKSIRRIVLNIQAEYLTAY